MLCLAFIAVLFFNCSESSHSDFIGVFSQQTNGEDPLKITHDDDFYLLHTKDKDNQWVLYDTLLVIPEDKLLKIFGETNSKNVLKGLMYTEKKKVFGSTARSYFFQMKKDENDPYLQTGYRFITSWGMSKSRGLLYKLDEKN